MTALRAAGILAALVLVLAFAVRCGRKAPAPATVDIHAEQSNDDKREASSTQTQQLEQRGPVSTQARTVVRKPDGTVITRTTLRVQAPVKLATVVRAKDYQVDHAEAQSWSDQRTTPVSPALAPPRWSLSLSLDNAAAVAFAHSAPQVRVGAGVRLVGPVWLEVTAAPFRGPELGAGIAVRW